MAEELIDNLISQQAIDKIDLLKKEVDAATSSVEALIAKGVELNKTFGSTKALKDFTNSSKDVDNTQKDIDKSSKQLIATQEKLAIAQSEVGKQTAQAQVQLQAQNKANKEAAIEALGLAGAYKTLNDKAAKATQAAQDVGAKFGLNSEEFKQASIQANSLNAELRDIDLQLNIYKRNIGNYAGSLNPAFKTLEEELERVTAKINSTTAASNKGVQNLNPVGFKLTGTGNTGGTTAEIESLIMQQQALQQVVSKSAVGFTSLTQELRSNERSLQSLRNAGLAETEAFKTLQTQTNHTRKEFNDFAKQQKILSSDVPALTGLTVAAKGLAGAYALGAGAAALFGDEEGKIDKEVQKLVAIMTVLQGLQEAHELLEQKDAIATALAAAAQKVYAVVVGESVGALAAFRIALAATGIGLFILTIAYLVENWKELFGAIDPVVDLLDKSTTINRAAKESLKAYGDTAEKITNGIIGKLKDQVKSLNDELKKTPNVTEDASLQLKLLQQRIISLNAESQKLKDNPTGFDEADAITIGENANEVEKLSKQVRELNVQLSITNQLQQFANKNEFNKARSEALNQSLKDQQDANTRLAADANASFKTKQDVLAANLRLEKIIIQRAYDEEESDADGNEAKILQAKTKRNSALLKADRDYNDQTLANKREYAKRNADAEASTFQTGQQARIDFNKKNADDESLDFSTRLIALRDFEDASLNVINSQEQRELATLGLTGKEKIAIEAKYQAQRDKLTEDTAKQRLAILVANAKEEGDLFKQVYDDIYGYLQARSKKFQDITIKNQAEFFKLIVEGVKNANAGIKREFDGLQNEVSKLFTRADGQSVEDYNNEIKDLTKSLEDIGSVAFHGAVAAVDNKFDAQKQALQDQIDLIDQRTQKEIDAVNQSSDAEDKKAAKIAQITARGEAQKRINEQKQRDIDLRKARFDRAAAIANIIVNTALAIVKALPVIPLAIAAGVLGAIQLAIAASAPLPTYFAGTSDHPGGAAIVGDGGKSELVVTPEGKLATTPSVPTVMNLPAHSIVYPDAREALAQYYGGMTVQKYNSLETNKIEEKLDNVVKAVKNIPGTTFTHTKQGWEIMKQNSIYLKNNWRSPW